MYGLFQRVHLPKQFPVAFLNTNRFSFCIKNPTPSTIPSKSLSAKDRQRILNANNYPQKNSRFKTSTYNNIAIGCLFFSLCFAGIPLYRSFCEHTGISGGTEKKAYEFKDTQLRNLKKFRVKFHGNPYPGVNWQFYPIQQEVFVSASYTAIVFFRLYNNSYIPIVGFSTYNIYPEYANLYFSKIQCFCFNQQLINPKEELLLPLFFYIYPEINYDSQIGRIKEITMTYNFMRSAKQDLARFAQEEIYRVYTNKRILEEKRAAKLKITHYYYLEMLEKEEINKAYEVSRLVREADQKQKIREANSKAAQIDKEPKTTLKVSDALTAPSKIGQQTPTKGTAAL